MLQFSISEPQAQMLTTWLVSALLPDCKPPILVITGEANAEAAMKLHTLIDPVTCALLPLPSTKYQYAEAALNNKVLAFQAGLQPTKLCTANLNLLSKGMSLPLKENSKSRAILHTVLHRPIIIAAEEPIKIHDRQLNIEINETRDAVHEQVLGALMDAVVRGIHEMSRQPARIPLMEPEALIMPGHLPQPNASPPS